MNKPNLPKNTQIILFDGVCNLCNTAIQKIIKRDKNRVFRYASLQSEIGMQLLIERNIDVTEIDSIILINPKIAYYYKSTAVLQIGKSLGGIFQVASIFLLLPVKFRDYIYDIVAKKRYQWFGKKDNCMLPTEELKELFL